MVSYIVSRLHIIVVCTAISRQLSAIWQTSTGTTPIYDHQFVVYWQFLYGFVLTYLSSWETVNVSNVAQARNVK